MMEMFDSICSECKQSSAKFEIFLSLHSPIGSCSHATCSPHSIVVQNTFAANHLDTLS